MADDERLGRDDVVGQRGSRRAQDREVTQNREISEADRLEMFRMTMYNDALPDLPNIPGYHLCWLSTTHQSDTIQKRLRLGYELLRADEVPGLEYTTAKTGEYVGCVAVNEMIAAKIPLSLFKKFMQEAHHDAPARDEESLGRMIDIIREQAESQGAKVIEGDGTSELHRSAPSHGVFAD